MGGLVRRYAHVPLGLVCLFALVALILWLLEQRVDAPWGSTALTQAPHQTAVPIPAGSPDASGAPAADSTPDAPSSAPASAPPAVPTGPVLADGERYALESGPFTSPESADAREEELNRLGFATIRFRKQDLSRFYVVAASGFASTEVARRVADEVGGAVVAGADGPELVLPRFPSLREAVAAARMLKTRGAEPRVIEEASPTVIYHIRYGQFTSQAAARSRSEELARLRLENRVVKVR